MVISLMNNQPLEKIEYYILENKKPVKTEDALEWAKWFIKEENRYVAKDTIYEKRGDATKRAEIEFVVADSRVEEVVETIKNVTKTGQEGDGRIYIFPIENAIHIHSGDRHLGDSSEEDLKDEL